ncbi:MAG: rhombosortase [Pseudomonadota bacterium]
MIRRAFDKLTQGRVPWVTLTVSLGALAVLLFGDQARELLIYDRGAIDGGQWWRLWTAHLVHADALHLFWNLSAFASLAGHYEIAPEGGRNRLLAMLAASSTLVGVGLYTLFPEWITYSGLSGVCYAPLIALLVLLGQRTGTAVFRWLVAGVVLKVGVELWVGGGLFEWFGSLQTATEVHALGLLVGAAAVLAWHSPRRTRSNQTVPDDLRSPLAGRV